LESREWWSPGSNRDLDVFEVQASFIEWTIIQGLNPSEKSVESYIIISNNSEILL
jgi:hypothetical protein